MGDLIRTLTKAEQERKYVDCCWTWRDQPNCVRLPVYRVATPHGHMDFCDEHVDYILAALPPGWLEGFAYREPVVLPDDGDIPF